MSIFGWSNLIYGFVKRDSALSGLLLSREPFSSLDDAGSRYSLKDSLPTTTLKSSPNLLVFEILGSSISKWLKAIETAEVVTAEAGMRVRQQVTTLQTSIILAQDNLSHDNTVGQHALKKKIDCAEKFHQTACQFNRVIDDVKCVATLARRLAHILDALIPCDTASTRGQNPQAISVGSLNERRWVTNQLTILKLELEQLDNRSNNVTVGQVSAFVASLKVVVKLLSQQADAIGIELRRLTAMIDEIDAFIVFDLQ